MPDAPTEAALTAPDTPPRPKQSDPDARRWRGFLRLLALTAASVVVATYALVLLVDPYDCLWFSPRLERMPLATSQRYAFPALARSPKFDSIVLGSSVVRHLRPADLDAAFGARFANLALDNGTPYEQWRLFDLFVRTHASPRVVIVGMDTIWCQPEFPARRIYEPGFPEWLYDDGRWNKLETLLSRTAVTDTIRQLEWLLGGDRPDRAADGFADLQPPETYDLERARRHLYEGQSWPRMQPPQVPAYAPEGDVERRWTFPDHDRLRQMLRALPQATITILLFTPTHHFSQPPPGSQRAAAWDACKRSVARVAADVPNAYVLDFLIHSPITLRDENYWDGLHYRVEAGSQVIALMADAVRRRKAESDFFRYLAGPPP
jgi:hypothetical protein